MNTEQIYEIYLQYPLICTDTRAIKKDSIFFALKGPHFNANTFAASALEKGAAYAVIDDASQKINEQYIIVDDVLSTLQLLAQFHRSTFLIPVIAIVGSNGKTTTKELLTAVLKTTFNVHATLGNFNNHIGLPLTLLQLTKAHDVAIIEMGANHIGENAALCEIACPTLGIITNNGKDHLEGFGSVEGVAKSNSELYYYLLKNKGTAFVNANDEWLMRMAQRLSTKITYAANAENKNQQANIIGLAAALRPQIKFTYFHNQVFTHYEITSNLSGDYNFDNIMAAVAIGNYLNVTEENVKIGIENYQPSNNRSQNIQKTHNIIFLDAYNANPSSMEASLRNFAAMPFNHKIAIIGDMFELGEFSKQEHINMIDYCSKLTIEEVWLVGETFASLEAKGMKQFLTTADAMAFLKQNPITNYHVFIKGSRGMKLETLVDFID